LASIIRGYKIGVTKFARQNNISFAWQPRYHDHVIRNAGEYERIHHYIANNAKNWAKDKFYSQLND
jgi:putative transposase